MPEYLSPGVYVEEIEIGSRPIEGVSTSTAGFLGQAERGPIKPRLITGFEEFGRVYGRYLGHSFLAYAVDGFFKNGGQRCFVGRIVHTNDEDEEKNASATSANLTEQIRIAASGPGEWGDRIAVKIQKGSLDKDSNNPDDREPKTLFKLTAMYWNTKPDPLVDPTDPQKIMDPNRREPELLEVYDNLSTDPSSIDFYENRINPQSNLIRLQRLTETADIPGLTQLKLLTELDGSTGGRNGAAVEVTDYQGSFLKLQPEDEIRTGLLGFEEIDEIAIVCVPDHHTDVNLSDAIITHCTKMKDRFAILHSKPSDTISTIQNIRPNFDTSYAAFYFPWINVYDPRIKRQSLVPPSGHIAGVYAKTDTERGVHKAPANVVLQGITDLQYQITKSEQDLLNPKGVNCLRTFPGRGNLVWGARTLSTNTLLKYVPVRRFLLYLEESIEEGTYWVVFEPNDERLWARVKATITEFLTRVWRDGALMGTKPEEAFFVKCDRTTMTPDDINNGRLICMIGVATVKPAEFVIFRIAQFTAGSAITA